MLLTTEYNKKDESIEIYFDREGLDSLMKTLIMLKETGGHDHLMTPSWAGNELSEEKQGENNELINHLCLILKPS